MQRRLDSLQSLANKELSHDKRQELVQLLIKGKSLSILRSTAGPGRIGFILFEQARNHRINVDIANLRADIAEIEALLSGHGSDSLLAAPGAKIAGGTSQIQKNIIGERILGLPKEPNPS